MIANMKMKICITLFQIKYIYECECITRREGYVNTHTACAMNCCETKSMTT